MGAYTHWLLCMRTDLSYLEPWLQVRERVCVCVREREREWGEREREEASRIITIKIVESTCLSKHLVYMVNAIFSDDDNRIPLRPIPDAQGCQGDYVNACYVDVSLGIQTPKLVLLLPTSTTLFRDTHFKTSLLLPKVCLCTNTL